MAPIVNPKVDLRQFRGEKEVPERQFFPLDQNGLGT
jgi:hypothetical protein